MVFFFPPLLSIEAFNLAFDIKYFLPTEPSFETTSARPPLTPPPSSSSLIFLGHDLEENKGKAYDAKTSYENSPTIAEQPPFDFEASS
jgi:hypothetical protein